jgi:hypothetical protein
MPRLGQEAACIRLTAIAPAKINRLEQRIKSFLDG